MIKYLFLAVMTLSLAAPVMAQDKKEPAKEVKKEEDAPAPKSTPLTKWIAAENVMIDKLGVKDKESVFILRNKHSVIRVIRVVERDIENAVKSCGKNNPDIKDKMNDRFKQWQNAVDPILDTAKKQLDKDVSAQTIVPVKELKNVLKLNDEAYDFGEKQTTKTPVTTKEACEGLVESMNDTESDMIELLQQTLLPESVIRSRAEKAKVQEEKEKSFARQPKAQ